jgi:NADH-ubiquinone oxidoreductase chain 2
MSLLFSSLLSLVIGTIVGLTQSRIKRLYAFSTISHVGFILLALSIHSVESTQAFMFYLMQYSISNLNAFMLIITIGYSLYCYVYKGDAFSSNTSSYEKDSSNVKSVSEKTNTSEEKKDKKNEKNENLQDVNNSPIQLIDQLKGYYYINPLLSLSLAITLFSFAGIPPLIGFFGKQMILSAAIDSGYIFMSLVAILTSVISAVYYLAVIKQIFFDKPDYEINHELQNFNANGLITEKNAIHHRVNIKLNNIVLSSSLSLSISIITLIISLFIFIPQE